MMLLDAYILDAWRPRLPEPAEQWVGSNIYFGARDGAVAGYWSETRFPYSKGVLEALTDTAVEEIVLSWGTQLGKTALLGAFLCWVAANDPASAMIACPNIASAREHYLTRLEPVLESCPAVAAMLPPKHARKMDLVDLGDMWVYYAYSGGRTSLSARSVRYLLITEINLWSYDESREGDPVAMARDRCKAFPNRKILIEGKPTILGECRVTGAYERSNQQTYHVPCPHCGRYQALMFGTRDSMGGLRWESDDLGHCEPERARETTYYRCQYCESSITEDYKISMFRKGRWLPKGQRIDARGRISGNAIRNRRISGFHLSSLYSTLLSWGEIAEAFLQAKAGTVHELQAFINGWLAEPFEQRARKTDSEELAHHVGDYAIGTVPGEPIELVMTVDVQQEGLWYVVRAWSYGATSWLVRYGYLDDFSTLDMIIGEVYPGIDGAEHRVGIALIDSGFRTTEVYEYCAARSRGFVPIKGEHQYRQAGIVALSKVPDWGLPLWRIDAGQARDQLYDRRLAINRGDPGFWELPVNIGGEYLRSLSAWQRRERRDKTGRQRMLWTSTSHEHEHLADCEIYQEAAAFHFGFGFRSKRPKLDESKRKAPKSGPKVAVRPDGRGWFER